jgi:hypothetical protein
MDLKVRLYWWRMALELLYSIEVFIGERGHYSPISTGYRH